VPLIALQPSFDDLSTPLYDVTFCVLDLETTGGSPRDCAITEIGAVKYRGGVESGVFQTLVDPGLPIPPFITVLTGITEAMMVSAPTIETALPSFLEFIGESVIVGHNVRFDLSFLSASIERLGYRPLDNPTVDTASLARRLIRNEVRNLRLHTLASHFRSPVTPVHRALEDARATAHVFHSMLERVGTMGVTNLDDLLALPRARGSAHYSKIALTEHLPRSPGVYVFLDRAGTPIYVGKAANLRARVRQYFYGDTRRVIGDLLRELHTIDTQMCATDLEAEVTELRLIHAHRPRYNRRSRPPKTSHFVKVTRERYPRLSVVRKLGPDGLAHLGPFRSKRAADEVVMALWDALPIRRCRGRSTAQTGKCAGAQIGVAACPCDGTTPMAEYAELVALLLEGLGARPEILLEPLVARMRRLASVERYEEASWVRDRHDALARCLESRRVWLSLTGAGLIEVEDGNGARVVIDHGVLVETRGPGRPPSLFGSLDHADRVVTEVPPSIEIAEEVSVIWRWMERSPIRIVESTGPLAMPAHRLDRLRMPDRRAA
jgi:DNA polymerase-3 subunit epsilon